MCVECSVRALYVGVVGGGGGVSRTVKYVKITRYRRGGCTVLLVCYISPRGSSGGEMFTARRSELKDASFPS